MPADNFVLVVKKFSFISVTGLDLDRVINIHPGVLDVFNKSADNATKKECIMTLLACLSYLFSKRPGPPVTRERYIHLLPHAIETLRSACDLHKEQCNFFGRSDFVVLTIVFDRIIYTLNSMGLNSDAKAFASNFLKMTPFFHNPCEKDPNKCAEAACDSFQESFNDDEKEKLQEIATEYILNKVRRKRNLAFVTRQDKADEYEYQISLADYRKLVDEGNAIDLKHSGTWLFFQVHISIALTIGMKRAEGSPNTEVTGNSLKYIKYATSLAAMLKQRAEFQQMNLYSVLDAEINGMVDLLLHKTTTNETDIDDALQTIKENMQSIKDNGYFVACVKTTCDADMCIYISAMKQIIRLLLWKYKYGQTNNQSYIDEAGKTADELMTYIAERKEVLRELFIAQTAKQWIVECFIRQERFDDALGALDELSSFDPLGDGDHILTKYDVIDIGLRCECYGRRQQDELRKTLDKVLEVKGLLLFDESEMMPLLRDLHEKFVRML
ncbi:hypothetical protein FSP39_004906 [Pinctada imbricata]|uniref:Uncharacterized protein n=1 Tax=Pinctada imbricata TaxID=66713 RepID=A0AA88YWL5_PINIB|nr:hypothetical protein FSP39_004906 [Pinctada imbricata]